MNVGAGLVQGPDASHEYMPKCPIELAARHGFYTPSGPFHEILRDIAEAVISRPDLIQLYDENERKTFISKIARSPYMLGVEFGDSRMTASVTGSASLRRDLSNSLGTILFQFKILKG